jgi:hypothetical protein
MKRNLFAVLFIFLLSGIARAQEFGGFPPSTRWKQIDTDTTRVIFIEGAEDQAQRIASLLHRMAAQMPMALGEQLRKINVVLHSRTTLANGYVALAPFRSEFYLIPGSNIFDFGNLPWAENLAIHEYRHVQQYNNMRHGASKALYYLFGERGQAFANALAVPDWFWEGDAVVAETALTPQGRGRLPYFLSGYNSLWLEGKDYSWMKLRNGSYRDYVPNHYQLGYLLANYGYIRYGADFWQKVTRDASAFKGGFYPFQKAIRKHANVSFETFRKEALDFYKQKLGPAPQETPRERKTVSYHFFPNYIGRDSILYLRSAYNSIPAFYIRDASGEHRVALKSIGSEEWLSYKRGVVAYTAFSTHPRWSLVDYNDIVLLDIGSGKETRITEKERYYTPDLSPSAEQIVAVHISDSLRSQLRVLDREGKVLRRIDASSPDDLFVNPRFMDENRVLVAVRTADAQMRWTVIDLQKGQTLSLTPASTATVGMPQPQGDTIFFTANYSGNDDLYAMKLSTQKLYRLTQGNTGYYYPYAQGDTLVYSQFTASGLELRKSSLQGMMWKEEQPVSAVAPSLYPVAPGKNILTGIDQRFSEKRYEKTSGFFRFHSWSPDYTGSELRLSLYSDNVLNTFSNTIYLNYNHNETSTGLGWNTSYGGFFTMLNAGLEYTRGRDLNFRPGGLVADQFEARAGYNIPLNFTKGRSYNFLNFGSNLVFTNVSFRGSDTLPDDVNTSYLHHFISWSRQLPRAVQHIYPKLSFATALNYRHRLDDPGHQLLASAQMSLPSFGNHSIVLSGSWQETDTSNVVFSNRFTNSRGYPEYYYSRMWRASANYHFPLFYPDFGAANIAYLKRVRGNAFYDYTRVYSADKTLWREQRSVGGEMFFDTQWWNMLPLSIGIRYSYLLDHNFWGMSRSRFEVTLPLDLIPD